MNTYEEDILISIFSYFYQNQLEHVTKVHADSVDYDDDTVVIYFDNDKLVECAASVFRDFTVFVTLFEKTSNGSYYGVDEMEYNTHIPWRDEDNEKLYSELLKFVGIERKE